MPANSQVAALAPWLQTQWQRLARSAHDGQMGHAIMMSGPVGVGKHVLANQLRIMALCSNANSAENEQQGGEACGACRSCDLARAGNHPDDYSIQPLEGKKNISVDQIRDIIAKLALSPSYENRKVALIAPAESMTTAAANALLKTLEEPPGDTLLILFSHAAWRLPATVMSRCQVIKCAPPSRDEAQQWLSKQGHDGAALEDALLLASNAPYEALEYEKQEVNGLFESVIEDLSSLRSGNRGLVNVATRWASGPVEIRLRCLYGLIRHLVITRLGQDGDLAHKSSLQSLHSSGPAIKLSALLGYQDAVVQTRTKLESPLNPQLLMENLLAPWTMSLEGSELEQRNQ